jgi:BirA family transcriptional regulator, biotin operon repressor / biotin---[acetyl-CoA-carboxylase] ligase
MGKEITVRLANETLQGIFEDIAEDGSLVLNQDGTIRHITAGDVFFGSPEGSV